MKYRIFSFIALTALLIFLAGCSASEPQENRLLASLTETAATSGTAAEETTEEVTTRQETTAAPTTVPATTETQPAEISLYDLLLTHLSAQELTFRLDMSLPKGSVNQTLQRILREHPELFWIKRWACTTTPSWTKLEIETEFTEQEIAERNDRLNAAVKSIADQVPSGADEFERALFVHDYIITHCDYDQEGAKDPDALVGVTAYDCLVDHLAVCSGYSRAYQMVLQRMGMECGICSGMSGSESHAWNYVQIGGKYYWVDVTFDDPVNASGSSSGIEHSYFLMDDEMLLRTRSIGSDDPFVPTCASLEQNYYVRNGLFLETYTPEAVDEILAREASSRHVEIMFRTAEACQQAMTDLLENEKIWDLQTIRSGGYTNLNYQFEDEMNVLILIF